jgi:hypothetical protein
MRQPGALRVMRWDYEWMRLRVEWVMVSYGSGGGAAVSHERLYLH